MHVHHCCQQVWLGHPSTCCLCPSTKAAMIDFTARKCSPRCPPWLCSAPLLSLASCEFFQNPRKCCLSCLIPASLVTRNGVQRPNSLLLSEKQIGSQYLHTVPEQLLRQASQQTPPRLRQVLHPNRSVLCCERNVVEYEGTETLGMPECQKKYESQTQY
jgi:hypothetical protein